MGRHRVSRLNVPDVVRGSVLYPPDGVDALALEFLGRVAANPDRSVPELNEGLEPAWQDRAAADLVHGGHLEAGGPCPAGRPRLAVTAAGREVLDGRYTVRKAG